MKHIFITFLVCIVCTTMAEQDFLSGTWQTGRRNTLVLIEKTESSYTGKIISSDNENVIHGMQIMKDIRLKKGEWTGKILFPKQDKWYDIELIPTENKLEIVATVGFFRKKTEWIRLH